MSYGFQVMTCAYGTNFSHTYNYNLLFDDFSLNIEVYPYIFLLYTNKVQFTIWEGGSVDKMLMPDNIISKYILLSNLDFRSTQRTKVQNTLNRMILPPYLLKWRLHFVDFLYCAWLEFIC